jgi:hypothetical protein
VRLAYAIHGNGPPLVVVSCWLSHLQHDWTKSPTVLAPVLKDKVEVSDERNSACRDRGPPSTGYPQSVNDSEGPARYDL